MADDFIESLLEAPYKSENEGSPNRMDSENYEVINFGCDFHIRNGKSQKGQDDKDASKKKSRKDKHSDTHGDERSGDQKKSKKKDKKEYEANGKYDEEEERRRKGKKPKGGDYEGDDYDRNKGTSHRSRSKKRSSSGKHSSHQRSDSGNRRGSDKYRSTSRRHDDVRRSRGDDHSRSSRMDDRRRDKLSPIPKATEVDMELTPEERDQRTVLFMQLGPYVTERDIMDFLKSMGKTSVDVRDIRLIVDSRTRKSKGLAYVEFLDPDSVRFALSLNGQKVKGRPIVVQHSQAEKNRLAILASGGLQKGQTGPMKLYVGSLHPNISEEMLKGIFEPFGKIDFINLIMDLESNKSRGYGFIQFHDGEDAKRACESLNGFELAGKPMKVSKFNERFGVAPTIMTDLPVTQDYSSLLDTEEMEKTGVDLGTTGRLQLMAKLAEGTGMKMPPDAQSALMASTGANTAAMRSLKQPLPQSAAEPPIATPCFMLSNMFDPQQESGTDWDTEIRDDVIEECDKHGGVQHIFIDKVSPQGSVYVKCLSIPAAVASVNSLHGRWFAGKMITAAYIPMANYYTLFGDAITAKERLKLTVPRD